MRNAGHNSLRISNFAANRASCEKRKKKVFNLLKGVLLGSTIFGHTFAKTYRTVMKVGAFESPDLGEHFSY